MRAIAPLLICLALLQVSSHAQQEGECPPSARRYVQEMQRRMAGNDAAAGLKLAEYYHPGQCIQRDYTKSREIYERLARQDNAEAEYRLGLIHLNGFGVPANRIIAEMWLNKAISHHHPTAQQLLEYMKEGGFDDC